MTDSTAKSSSEMETIARQLISRDPSARSAGEQLFERLPADHKQFVGRKLASQISRTGQRANRISSLATGLAVLEIVLNQLFHGAELPVMFVPICALGVAFFYNMYVCLRRQCSALVHVLADSPDPGQVGLLIEIGPWVLKPNRDAYSTALERSVGLLSQADADLVTRKQVAQLVERISQRWSTFGRATAARNESRLLKTLSEVKALAAVGAGRELDRMERLARKQPHSEAQNRMRDLLLEVLPGWKARLAAGRDTDSLLRASQSHAQADGQSLLRGAEVTSANDPEELLRPGDHMQ
jgi:hypothetical protein